jgi:hypothetical protein
MAEAITWTACVGLDLSLSRDAEVVSVGGVSVTTLDQFGMRKFITS